MANRKRKQGIFVVNSEVVLLLSNESEERKGTHISVTLETVFKHIQIAGNRACTIESYEYIFKKFEEACGIVVAEEIDLDKPYHYLEVLQFTPATKLIRLKSIKAILSKFYNNGWVKRMLLE